MIDFWTLALCVIGGAIVSAAILTPLEALPLLRRLLASWRIRRVERAVLDRAVREARGIRRARQYSDLYPGWRG